MPIAVRTRSGWSRRLGSVATPSALRDGPSRNALGVATDPSRRDHPDRVLTAIGIPFDARYVDAVGGEAAVDRLTERDELPLRGAASGARPARLDGDSGS